jgi:hypothetical protein
MCVVFGLALVDGSILLMFLLASESKIEERLFSEITYQMSSSKILPIVCFFRDTVSATMRQQIDGFL